jgi:FtsH-binding integral membrane protein
MRSPAKVSQPLAPQRATKRRDYKNTFPLNHCNVPAHPIASYGKIAYVLGRRCHQDREPREREIEETMSYEPNRGGYADPRAASRYDIDTGLRQHMLRVYNYMAGGLAVTGLVALFAVSTGIYQAIAHTPLMWVAIFAPFAIVLLMGFRIQQMSMGAVQLAFWAFAALMGLSLAGIFLVYTQTSIALTFFITASMFLFMSLYGYTTKRDLSGMGSFMMMGLFGIIIASLVNMFLHSTGSASPPGTRSVSRKFTSLAWARNGRARAP